MINSSMVQNPTGYPPMHYVTASPEDHLDIKVFRRPQGFSVVINLNEVSILNVSCIMGEIKIEDLRKTTVEETPMNRAISAIQFAHNLFRDPRSDKCFRDLESTRCLGCVTVEYCKEHV